MAESKPLVVAFVSGKGGVGKTMLSVAFARELSTKSATLLVDLDFFNRGLTGLMPEGKFVAKVNKPKFLSKAKSGEELEQWEIRRIDRNIFYVSYPDIHQDDLRIIETLQIDVLKEALQEFTNETASLCECSCIVLDCHGGPDNLSFAACLISDKALLISEPDKITFYGTMNFIRQMKWVCGESDLRVYLIFNKVVPVFSSFFLQSFYNRVIKRHFSNHPLLAIFPLEVYLTKEFEKTLFLTDVYPMSLLARKTRVLLKDLLESEYPDKLSKSILTIPRVVAMFRRLSLGKPITLLNLNFILPTIAIIALTVWGFEQLPTKNIRLEVEEETARKKIEALVGAEPNMEKYFPSVARFINNKSMKLQDFQKNLRVDYENLPSKFSKYDTLMKNTYDENRYQYLKRPSYKKARKYGYALLYIDTLPNIDYNLSRDSLCGFYLALEMAAPSEPSEYYSPYYVTSKKLCGDMEVPGNLKSVLQDPKLEPSFLEGVIVEVSRFLDNSGWLGSLAFGWIITALLLQWSKYLDQRFMYFFKKGKPLLYIGLFLIVLLLWFFPLLSLGYLKELKEFRSEYLILLPSLCLTLIIVMNQVLRGYRGIRYETNATESVLRLSFAIYLVVLPYILSYFF